MAKDKITIELEIESRRAQREVDKIQKQVKALGKSMGVSMGGGKSGGADKVRALGTGLSKATVKADEFSKSMEASNARVIAFGASAGLIMGVDRALRAMVASAIKVEKAMMDVNIVMDLNSKQLEKFGRGMFKVAKETAQGFETVAEATTEFARQGLGMEKTLVRTKDALILTRLTGMNAADSVKSLTAAVNSFNKEGVTSAQVINRMAKVDQKFAVSSEDLAKSISRVGASAVAAGVNMNELMAITTAVQQRTARGGAVIGNAFKTIFTRIQRSDVKTRLRDLGVAITDNNGKMLSGMKVLQNLANEFDNLSRAQKSQISENVAGVFQVNILKAALADLSQETSNYKGALEAASSATDEAYQKNEKLNTTLDTLVNKTLVNLTQAGATLGGATLGPAIERVLNTVNSTIEAFGKEGRFASFGEGLGKDLLAGIGRFMSGPGVALATAVFAKLALSLGKFASQAFKDILGINDATKQRAALEEAVVQTIMKEPGLLNKVKKGTLDIKTLEQDILTTLKLQSAERAKMQAYAAPVAKALGKRGVVTGSKGVTIKPPGRAGGFVPSFAAGGERAAAAAGGYAAGAIKTMNQPGAGSVMYNSAETVKRFPGMSQSAIMPPQGSPAGAGYKAAFGAAHGFDPYAGAGFIPNFPRVSTKRKKTAAEVQEEEIMRNKKKYKEVPHTIHVNLQSKKRDIGIVTEHGSDASPIEYRQDMKGKTGIPQLASHPSIKSLTDKGRMSKDGRLHKLSNIKFNVRGIPIVPLFPIGDDSGGVFARDKVEGFKPLETALNKYAKTLSAKMFKGGTAPEIAPFKTKDLNNGTMGDIFEAGLRSAVGGNPSEDKAAAFDFSGAAYAPQRLIEFLNTKNANLLDVKSKIESKIGFEAASSGHLPKKFINDALAAEQGKGERVGSKWSSIMANITKQFKTKAGISSAAMGFVPNFSPLTDAVGREMTAGVPASAIKVGSNPALKSSGNRGGLGVYNTIDEPGGLGQGISRSRSQGMNPKTHGAAGGFVPNFPAPLVIGPILKALAWIGTGIMSLLPFIKKTATATSKTATAAAAPAKEFASKHSTIAGVLGYGVMDQLAGAGPGGQVASTMGWMGGAGAAMGGPGKRLKYGLMGAGFGAFTQWSNISKMLGEDADTVVDALQEEAEAQKSLGSLAMAAAASVKVLGEELDALTLIELRKKTIETLRKENPESFARMEGTKEYRNVLKASSAAQLGESLGEYGARANRQKAIREVTMGVSETQSVGILGVGRQKLDPTFGQGMEEQLMKKFGVSSKAEMLEALKLPSTEGDTSDLAVATYNYYKRKKEIEESDPTIKGVKGAGTVTGKQYLSAIMGTDAFSSDRIMARLRKNEGFAAGGANAGIDDDYTAKLKESTIPQIMAMATGADAKDFEKQAEFIKSFLDPKQIEEFRASLIAGVTDLDTYNAYVKKAEEIEKQKAIDSQKIIDTNLGLINSVTSLNRSFLLVGQAADLTYKLQQKANKQSLAMYKVDQQISMTGASSFQTKRGMIDLQETTAKNLAVETRIKGIEGLGDKRTRDITKAQVKAGSKAGIEFLKLMEEGKLAGKGGINREAGMKAANAKMQGMATEFGAAKTPKEAAAILAKYMGEQNTLLAKKSEEGAELKWEEGYTLSALNTILPELQKIMGDTISARELILATEEDQKEAAEKAKELAIARYKSEIELNEEERRMARGKKVLLAIQEEAEARTRFGQGQIGFGGLMSSKRANLEARRAATGMNEAEIRKEFGDEGAALLKGQNLTAAGIAADDLKLTIEELDNSFSGAGNNIVDSTRIMANALRDAASDLVSFEEATQSATAREKAEGYYKKGLITSDQLRGRRAADRLNRRRRGGARSGDMMEAFRDQFLYNGQDHMDEFEEGVIGVAETMKSSFADAFKSLTSGASSGKEALKAFADSILNSISDISAKMATNMLFSSMGGNAQGGYIPRFQGGGVVAGGSGFKDDVPALMSGGEYVIKKSSAQKIGYGTLNAINSGGSRGGSIPHYAEGGSTAGSGEFSGTDMAKMYGISAAASMASGYLNRPDKTAKQTSRNYGLGRDEYGYFGGADPDAGGSDAIRGGGRRASVSLNKAFVYYRRDPVTGQLISERARPTEGRFETSSLLSTRAMLREDDPQTARIFSKEGKMAEYQQTRADWKKNKEDTLKAHYKAQNARTIGAWVNAAMIIAGGYKSIGADWSAATSAGGATQSTRPFKVGSGEIVVARGGSIPKFGGGGKVSPAMLMGGEYVMSPEAVRTHGVNFMSELNRGNVPGGAGGGFFMGGGGGAVSGSAPTTNNVKININIDKSGKAEVGSSTEPLSDGGQDERDTNNEAQDNKNMAELLQGVVLSEIAKQQRPGGLLQNARP